MKADMENMEKMTNATNERLRIGRRVEELRKEKGYSVRQFAELCGISYQNITKIEHGREAVGFDILQRIADALGCRVDLI